MKKQIAIAVTAWVAVAGAPCFASEADQIRQDCEAEVQSYGITDAEQYQQALNDCIDSLSGASGEESDNKQPSE